MQYRLEVAGAQIADARIDPTGQVAPGQEQTISLPVRFAPAQLGLAGLNMLRGGQFAYRLTGNLSAETPWGMLTTPLMVGGQ